MIYIRCKMVAKSEFEKLGLHHHYCWIGEMEIIELPMNILKIIEDALMIGMVAAIIVMM